MSSIRILLVEDSITQAMRLRYVLEAEGFDVDVAANGADALTFLENNAPDLIISDVMMPKMNGYELCRKIRENPRYKETPIMLVTTLSDPTDVIRALEAGADNFTTKPYNEQALISRIRYILANAEIRKQRGSEIGIEVFFSGKKYFINSTRIQMIDFLLSTYESAIQKNQELFVSNNKLKEALDNIITLQRNYRQLLETSQDAILVYDKDKMIRYANPAAHALFSKEQKGLIGARLPIEEDISTQKEIEIKDPYGNTIFLDARSVSTDWDNETMTLSVLRDITESTQLRKELEQISLTDDLTGLYNRRGFKILSERMIKLARRLQANMFILFGDMDGLKSINDTLGHLEGDNAIRTMASIFKSAFRESDLVARMGGDEFAVIGLINENFVPNRLVERMNELIGSFNAKGEAKFKLAVSIGIERIAYDSQVPIEEMLSVADTKMYKEKEGKR
jgi:two-component system cell cycle response regulator